MSRRAVAAAAAAAILTTGASCGCASSVSQPGAKTKPSARARVISSIASGIELTRPVRWVASVTGVPANDVTSVLFLIDGKVSHLAYKVPYTFDGIGNDLLPGAFRPGSHVFAVDVKLADGRQLTTASTALVSPSAFRVPRQLLGHWIRKVTVAEVARTDSFRLEEPGDEPLPVGTWKLQISADGVARYIDPTATHDLTVGQLRFEPGGLLVSGNLIPNFPHGAHGGFCGDNVGSGLYRWSLVGNRLVVKVQHDHQCADRNSFWDGTFTRPAH